MRRRIRRRTRRRRRVRRRRNSCRQRRRCRTQSSTTVHQFHTDHSNSCRVATVAAITAATALFHDSDGRLSIAQSVRQLACNAAILQSLCDRIAVDGVPHAVASLLATRHPKSPADANDSAPYAAESVLDHRGSPSRRLAALASVADTHVGDDPTRESSPIDAARPSATNAARKHDNGHGDVAAVVAGATALEICVDADVDGCKLSARFDK